MGAGACAPPLPPLSGPACQTRNQYPSTLTQCWRLLLCQVSSHCNQGFSFYRANIPTQWHRYSHTHMIIIKSSGISALPY